MKRHISILMMFLLALLLLQCREEQAIPYPGIHLTFDFIRGGMSSTRIEDTLIIKNIENDLVLKTKYSVNQGLQTVRIDTLCSLNEVSLLVFERDSMIDIITVNFMKSSFSGNCLLKSASCNNCQIISESIFSLGVRINK